MAMNQTSAALAPELTELAYILDLQNGVIIIESLIVFGMSIVQLLLLMALIWVSGVGTLSVFKPVNCVLLLMIIANGVQVASYRAYWINNDPEIEAVSYGIYSFFALFLKYLIMLYSWLRGRSALELVASSSVPVARVTLVVYALSMSAVFVLSNIDTTPASLAAKFVIIALNNILLGCSETLVLVAFAVYLRRIGNNSALPDAQKLKTIAMYGLVSAAWLLVWLVVTEVLSVTDWNVLTVPVQLRYLVLSATAMAMPLVFIFIQLLMKLALHRGRHREAERMRVMVEKARLHSNQTS
ncbi:hypothetical protein BC830DRAFT_1174043 [Chytriomyces sp. MP71]|nr:hypothetical protein BC830DRAFT_1174043 [Chytriomyces sp. MP71]